MRIQLKNGGVLNVVGITFTEDGRISTRSILEDSSHDIFIHVSEVSNIIDDYRDTDRRTWEDGDGDDEEDEDLYEE